MTVNELFSLPGAARLNKGESLMAKRGRPFTVYVDKHLDHTKPSCATKIFLDVLSEGNMESSTLIRFKFHRIALMQRYIVFFQHP